MPLLEKKVALLTGAARGIGLAIVERLAREGAAGPMLPSFPSKTFPNHWTLVTGLSPDRHGIVGNQMEDPSRPGETFTMASDDPFWWNAAEPMSSVFGVGVSASTTDLPEASWPVTIRRGAALMGAEAYRARHA